MGWTKVNKQNGLRLRYTPAVESDGYIFPVPDSNRVSKMDIIVAGAGGGSYGGYASGGAGGLTKATGIDPANISDDALKLVPGQSVNHTTDGSFQGGGYGDGSSKSQSDYGDGSNGGGYSIVAPKSYTPGDSVDDGYLIAGGGGGGGDSSAYGGDGGGLQGDDGSSYSGSTPSSGATQTDGYAKGQGEFIPDGQCGAGGGGYYGGYSVEDSGGGGGSGYIDSNFPGSKSTVQGGGPSSETHGYIEIVIQELV